MGLFSEMFAYSGWWMKSKLGSKAPLVDTLIIHYGCNLRCKHCQIAIETEAGGAARMPSLSFEDIAKDLSDRYEKGARIAYFEGGETTLWKDGGKDLGDLIAEAKRIGYINVGYTTNGTGRVFTDSDIISVSLDGDRETHDLIRGEGVFDRMMKNISESGFTGHIYANCVLQRSNIGKIREIADTVRSSGFMGGIIFNFLTPPPYDQALTIDEKERAVSEIKGLIREGYPIFNSKKGLELLLAEDWGEKCPKNLSVFLLPDGSHARGCPMEGTESCGRCGFAAVREYYLIDRGSPSAIMSLTPIFARSKERR